MRATKLTKNLTKIKIIKGHIVQRTGASVIIFDTEKSTLHTFNNTATFIFERLKKNINIEKINNDFATKFGLSKEMAEKDVEKFIEMMISKGLAVKKKSSK